MPDVAGPVLETRGLSCHFGGVVAVDAVSLEVRPGEIHCVIGPNGAGKSTLFHLITGFAPVTRGEILFHGRRITRWSPDAIARRGIARTFQIPSLLPDLRAGEHIRLAVQSRQAQAGPVGMLLRRRQPLTPAVEAIAADMGLADVLDVPVSHLPLGHKKRLEIAMALGMGPSLLMLDEPTAGMTVGESHEMAATIDGLGGRIALLVVEHDMDVVRAIADRVTVLHRGSILASGSIEVIEQDERVRTIYLGDDGGGLKC